MAEGECPRYVLSHVVMRRLESRTQVFEKTVLVKSEVASSCSTVLSGSTTFKSNEPSHITTEMNEILDFEDFEKNEKLDFWSDWKCKGDSL